MPMDLCAASLSAMYTWEVPRVARDGYGWLNGGPAPVARIFPDPSRNGKHKPAVKEVVLLGDILDVWECRSTCSRRRSKQSSLRTLTKASSDR